MATSHCQHDERSARARSFVPLIAAVTASSASGGGSRERGDAAPSQGPLRGQVTAVRTLSDGSAELTVRRPDDS